LKLSLPHQASSNPRGHRLCLSGRALRGILVLVGAYVAAFSPSPVTSGTRDLPDAHTWHFFSEKKLRSRLYYSVPGVSDSVRVSEDPACCPVVSPNGSWVACTNFNKKAIESELLILSRQSEQWRPFPGYTVISYQWSPDGSRLAGYGKRRTAAGVCFFAIQPLTRAAWFADSISIPEDYEFAWDSTSSHVAICRPGNGSRSLPRVLILTLPSRKVGTIATLSEGEPTNPRWLPNGALVVAKKLGGASDSSSDMHFPSAGR